MPSVTIAILNFNGISLLKTFLPSVIEHSKGHDIVVIDNGSSDNSVVFLKEKFPEVSIISLDKNYGFCQGYNKGLSALESDYFVLLNSDVEVTENWIDPIISRMENDPKVAACQPKILSYKNKGQFEYAGAAGGFIDWLGYPFCRGRIFGDLEKDQQQYDEPTPVFWASGACFFVKSKLFRESGGFCDEFFAHMEEIDLCWRFQNAGYSIWCEPQSKVYHLGGGTLDKSSSRKTYLNFRNNLATLHSNLPVSKLIYIVPIRMALDSIAAISFLFTGGPGHFWAVLKAYFTVFGIRSRQLNNKEKGSPRGILNRSIVMAHYLGRVRKYSQLKTF